MHLAALALTALIFLVNGVLLPGSTSVDSPYIANQVAFAFELSGDDMEQEPAQWIDTWFFHAPPPANARLLGKVPIYLSYRLANYCGLTPLDAFYLSYLAWTAAFVYAFLLFGARCVATIAGRIEMLSGPAHRRLELPSMVILALLPPVLFAFKFPVHGSPNEFLGYALIAACMNTLLEEHLARFCVFALLGVPCRETNLLTLLPMLVLGSGDGLRRGLIALAVVLASLAFRLTLGGHYAPTAGAEHNWIFPAETLAFAYLVFGPLWMPAALSAAEILRNPPNREARLYALCALVSVLLVVAAVMLFARMREIRITYTLWIYVVPLALAAIDSFMRRATRAQHFILGCCMALGAALTLGLYMLLLPRGPADFTHKAGALLHFYSGFGGGWSWHFLIYALPAIPLLAIGLFLPWLPAVRAHS